LLVSTPNASTEGEWRGVMSVSSMDHLIGSVYTAKWQTTANTAMTHAHVTIGLYGLRPRISRAQRYQPLVLVVGTAISSSS